MKHYIGIDLGGTNIKGALVNENGEIVKQNTCPTHAEQGVDGRTAFTAQQMGDAAGDEVIKTYIHYLSAGIANIVNIFFPEVIALSSGVANQGENLLAPLREKVGQQEYGAAYTAKHPCIICCTLGNTAGMIGAAMFAKE